MSISEKITERKLAEEKFKLVVESVPNAIVMIDQEGKIKLVNSETEKLFGFRRSELIGQSVDNLVPKRYRTDHLEHRNRFSTDPQKRQMGVGRDLFAVRKDGSEFPAEIGLNPIRTKDGLIILCSIA